MAKVMQVLIKRQCIILFTLFLFVPGILLAHNPRIVKENITEINNPEVSQAFYGELRGKEAEFIINSEVEFRLYAGVLVPDIKNVNTDIMAEIYRFKDEKKETLAFLDGSRHEWKPYYEEYAQDNYLWGPEYRADNSSDEKDIKGRLVPAGNYRVKVYSPSNLGKYVLVVGFLEAWSPKDIIKALIDVPPLKLKFFEEPVLKVLLSTFGLAYIIFLYLLAGITDLAYRFILQRLSQNSNRRLKKNIGTTDRLFRAAIGIGLLIWAVMTSWSPILIFLSGFVIFESIFSWCGLYAALGKNTCPL
ncbi:DUF2892 domain-containing protein [Elusimicrobiota bacterium]